MSSKPITWACGITTVPSRADGLLRQSIESLARAGFDRPVLYVDGLDPSWSPPCDEGQLAGVVIHQPPVGHTPNWVVGLSHLFATQPHATYYAMFEDDLLANQHLRAYLERCTYPKQGYWNLLTHPENLVKTGGVDGWHLSNQRGRGAVGLVFNRSTAQAILSSRIFLDRCRLIGAGGAPAADGVVMDALSAQGYFEYIHCPTLLQHMGGNQSTLGHNYGEMLGWRGEDYNIMQILDSPPPPPPAPPTREEIEAPYLAKMVPPSQPRLSVWRGGVIQIHVTRACDMACFNCTQGSNLAGKPVMITVEEFEQACQSLKGYWGVVGMFGGNPALHPQFEELCAIFRSHFPKEQRGLWCNHPHGHGKVMRETFDPTVSNLNVHLNKDAFNEFKRDWPESLPFGLDKDSHHSPPWAAMIDMSELPWPDGSRRPNTERNRLELISNCDINQRWSAMVCKVPGKGLRGFFCEIAGAQAMLHCNDPNWPDTGVPAVEGWWTRPMEEFIGQVRQHCHRCSCPLKLKGQLAIGGEFEQTSDTHLDICKPKVKHRPVEIVQLEEAGEHVEHMTDYLQNAGV